nr:MAG TPA: hypothetical protein [Caudoviricetes sp.]
MLSFCGQYRQRVTLPCDAPHALALSLSCLSPINHKNLILAIFRLPNSTNRCIRHY